MKITESTTVQEAFKQSKDTADVFTKYGLECHRCKGSAQVTIRIAAENYGIDLAAFLKDLNACLTS